jgi:hypothetical protein
MGDLANYELHLHASEQRSYGWCPGDDPVPILQAAAREVHDLARIGLTLLAEVRSRQAVIDAALADADVTAKYLGAEEGYAAAWEELSKRVQVALRGVESQIVR